LALPEVAVKSPFDRVIEASLSEGFHVTTYSNELELLELSLDSEKLELDSEELELDSELSLLLSLDSLLSEELLDKLLLDFDAADELEELLSDLLSELDSEKLEELKELSEDELEELWDWLLEELDSEELLMELSLELDSLELKDDDLLSELDSLELEDKLSEDTLDELSELLLSFSTLYWTTNFGNTAPSDSAPSGTVTFMKSLLALSAQKSPKAK
jgi:hypothetical protein